jgi:transcriptional regulator with XRE-family HTH domain
VDIYRDNFAKAFVQLLEQSGVTCYQIEGYTGLNQAYLSPLKKGEKSNPSPETIMKISLALAYFSSKITIHDIEGLFRSVGRSVTKD